MYRRVTVALLVGGVSLLFAARHSPAFNAQLSSPGLVQSLSGDYLAVDALYGGATDPSGLDAALRRLTPPTLIPGVEPWRPAPTVTRADDGIRLALAAQRAIGELGSTAELAPIRAELLVSYGDVEQAWRLERRIELALASSTAAWSGPRLPTLDLQQRATDSTATIHRARSLHDQAMTAVRVLGGMPSHPVAVVGQ
jgi:hypothetical protein